MRALTLAQRLVPRVQPRTTCTTHLSQPGEGPQNEPSRGPFSISERTCSKCRQDLLRAADCEGAALLQVEDLWQRCRGRGQRGR